MNPKRLEIAEATDDASWDAFVEQSPQGTVFSSSMFLRSLRAPYRRYVIHAGGACLAQIAAVEDAFGNAVRPPFTPYQGILFSSYIEGKRRQRVLDEFRVTQFVVQQLTQRHTVLEMALSWQFTDMRPFLWHNYGNSALPQFHAQPRYTGVLNLEEINPMTYVQDIRTVRRQELKKAAAFKLTERGSIPVFMELYRRTFARQSIEVAEDRLELMRSITETALENGAGRLSACETPEGPAAMSLILYDTKRAYYLFGANDPAQRNTGASTRLMVDNILDAKRRGCREFDFVGVNSPTRGDFKLSFNANLQLYFELNYTAGSKP